MTSTATHVTTPGARPGLRRATAEARFAAMGSRAHVVVVAATSVDAARLAARAERRVAGLERRWSRFLADSEVSRLNAAAGRWVTVSADTERLVTEAVAAWHHTGGVVDATVLGDVRRAGYERSFAGSASPAPSARPSRSGGVPRDSAALPADGGLRTDGGSITLIPGAVRLGPATGIDPGGIGKGLAADIVVEELLGAGALGALANIGGDLRCAGVPPDDGPASPAAETGRLPGWGVGIEHRPGGSQVCRLGILGGAVATSSTLRRAWMVDGESRHHLIDPATGRPGTSAVTSATAVAARGVVAEALAKLVVIRGLAAVPVAVGLGAEVLAGTADGSVVCSAGLPAFLAEPPPVAPTVLGPTPDDALSAPDPAGPSVGDEETRR